MKLIPLLAVLSLTLLITLAASWFLL